MSVDRSGCFRFGVKEDGSLGFLPARKEIALYFREIYAEIDKPEFKAYSFPLCDTSRQLTKIDWLRFSGGVESLHLVADLIDLFEEINPDLQFAFTQKQMLGYSESYVIQYWRDNQLMNVGFLGIERNLEASHVGICCDLSGTACDILQTDWQGWKTLVQFIAGYRFRITRCDIALDLQADFNNKFGYSLPKFAELYAEGAFNNDRGTNHPQHSLIGEWLEVPENIKDYNPLQHAQRGLTLSIGSRSGARYIRCYEKGKEIAGKVGAAVLERDANWIRVEVELKRGSGKVDIPHDVLLCPDQFFAGRKLFMHALLNQYREYCSFNRVDRLVFCARAAEKQLLIRKKVLWAKRQIGRLVHTLRSKGLTDSDIIDSVIREEGLKEFIWDFEYDTHN